MNDTIFIGSVIMCSDPGSADPGRVAHSAFLTRDEAVKWVEDNSNLIGTDNDPDGEYQPQWADDVFKDFNNMAIYWGMVREISTLQPTEDFMIFEV